MTNQSPPKIVVDVGGTNTRIAAGEDIALYRNDDHQTFESVLDAYFVETGRRRGAIAVSAAGPEEFAEDRTPGRAQRLLLTNRGWTIDRHRLEAAGFSDIRLFNDLYAAASGALSLSKSGRREAFLPVCGEGFAGQPTFAVVGLGTGVGCGVVLGERQVLATEAGHMPASLDAETAAAYAGSHVLPSFPSYERVLSGVGFKTLIEIYGQGPNLKKPKDIVPAAQAGDAGALRILDVFHATLGRLLTAVVAAYKATGGVCLVSDFLRGWGNAFDRQRVEAEYLRDVPTALRYAPVVLLDHDHVPLVGLEHLSRR